MCSALVGTGYNLLVMKRNPGEALVGLEEAGLAPHGLEAVAHVNALGLAQAGEAFLEPAGNYLVLPGPGLAPHGALAPEWVLGGILLETGPSWTACPWLSRLACGGSGCRLGLCT